MAKPCPTVLIPHYSGRRVKLKGEAKHWDIVSDSGKVKTRAFCAVCGSPVYMTFAARPDRFIVHAASLDDPSRYRPQLVTCGVSGHAWDHIDPTLPKFDKMPGARKNPPHVSPGRPSR